MPRPCALLALPICALFVMGLGCGDGASKGSGISGEIVMDGSSTVGPILAAAAELFQEENPDSEATVAMSGTSGGFKKLVAGEADIVGASRPVKPEEIEQLKEAGIEFIEVPVAMDGLTVVVNKANTWARSLTLDELRRIWEPGSKVTSWAQVRRGFPDEPIKLFGAGTDSGTFDYFTLAVVGKEKASRDDYTPSEDDNVLVAGVMGELGGLAYFGYSYFESNKDSLAAAAIQGEAGTVAPSYSTILDGTYTPLSRPLLVYVNKRAYETKPQVRALLAHLFQHNDEIVKLACYVPLGAEVVKLAQARLQQKRTGSMFHGTQAGISIRDLLDAEKD